MPANVLRTFRISRPREGGTMHHGTSAEKDCTFQSITSKPFDIHYSDSDGDGDGDSDGNDDGDDGVGER